MLIISRKTGQSILIGDEIEVTVTAVRGDQIRLAISAPRSVTVLRKEVVEQVTAGNNDAVTAAGGVLDLLGGKFSLMGEEPDADRGGPPGAGDLRIRAASEMR
jgi:carbon storage regulator